MAEKQHSRSRKQRGSNASSTGPRVVPPEHLRDVGGPSRVYARRLVGRRDAVVHGPHAHRFLEIVFIEKGRGAHIVEGKRVPVGPGDVFALAPGQAHDPDELDSTIHWVLAFELRFLFKGRDERELFVSCPDEVVLLCFLRRPNDGVHLRLSPENARAWVSWLERLERELERRELGYASAAKGLVELMLVDLARMVEPYIPHVELKQRPRLARVFRFIEEHFRTPLKLGDLARAAGLSSAYLTTLLKKQTGRSAGEWLTARRMAEARRLLAETSSGVKTIGFEVGYADTSHFIEVFSKEHGLTPKAWREGAIARKPDRSK
jgi:AraC family transcriptional regulator, transcriptional activator of pobA